MTTDTLSPQQLAANQTNAKLGGVKTEEGKAVSKHNALKHGLLSKETLLEGEDEKALAELGDRMREELNPANTLESLLVDRIVANVWRLRRALEVERNAMLWSRDQQEHPLLEDGLSIETKKQKTMRHVRDMIAHQSIEKIQRYETTIERSMYRAIHELWRLQAARTGKGAIVPIVIDVDVTSDSA